MIDHEFEERIKCLAEESAINSKQVPLLIKVFRYLLKDVENRALRALLANPERFSGSGDSEKAIKEWIWESLINSKLEIIKIFPNRSQVTEFIEFEYKANPDDDDIEIEEFITRWVNRSIGIDETENEKFLRRFLNKSIRLARDHWKNFGNFEMGAPETSAFKKYESLIRGYLLKLGVFTPDPFRPYMSGYMNRYEQQKAEAFRTMDENPSFCWNNFASLFRSMPLDLVAAIFSAEIDPAVWTLRVKALENKKVKDGAERGHETQGRGRQENIEELRKYIELRQQKYPGISCKKHVSAARNKFVKKEDKYSPKTFDNYMKEIKTQI